MVIWESREAITSGGVYEKGGGDRTDRIKNIGAALEEFDANGYAGGTINSIYKRGINKGLIYHNFKDKDALYLVCLENSCKNPVTLVEESGCAGQLQYMKVRMHFFTEYPNEAHIFFEAILQPQEKLRDRIQQILQPFEEINERICRAVISDLVLRDGITEEDAMDYFRQMQRMFNGYFSSSAYRYMALDQRIREHELNLAKLLDFMLYGVAKSANKNDEFAAMADSAGTGGAGGQADR